MIKIRKSGRDMSYRKEIVCSSSLLIVILIAWRYASYIKKYEYQKRIDHILKKISENQENENNEYDTDEETTPDATDLYRTRIIESALLVIYNFDA